MSKPRLQFLDTLRGFGMLFVFLYHSAQEVSGDTMRWKYGLWNPLGFDLPRALTQYALQCCSVPSMFFLISGFLIHRHQCSGRVVDMHYVKRRNLRLYLPYMFVLVLFVAAYFTPHPPRYWPPDAGNLVLHALLLFSFFGSESAWSINPSFWFVAAEILLCFAYLLWHAVIVRSGWKNLMMLLFAIEVATRFRATTGDNGWLYATPSAYVFTWMLGALLAEKLAQDSLPARSGLKAAGWGIVVVLATGVQKLQFFASMAFAAAMFYLISWLLRRKPQTDAVQDTAGPVRLRDKLLDFVRVAGRVSLWAYLLNQPILYYIETAARPFVADPLSRLFFTALCGWSVVLPLAWLLQRYLEPRLINAVTDAEAAIRSWRTSPRRTLPLLQAPPKI